MSDINKELRAIRKILIEMETLLEDLDTIINTANVTRIHIMIAQIREQIERLEETEGKHSG